MPIKYWRIGDYQIGEFSSTWGGSSSPSNTAPSTCILIERNGTKYYIPVYSE